MASISALQWAGLYMVFIGLAFMLCAWIEPSEKTYQGRAAIFFTIKLPGYVSSTVLRLCGPRVHQAGSTVYNYVFNTPNPILQIFYLIVILGCYTAFLVFVLPSVERSAYVSSYHVWFCYFILTSTLVSFYFACSVGPGYITVDNVGKFDHYPYDKALFYEGAICKTCNVKKVARSKHCRMMGRCIARFDHYCPWVGQSVGEENYRHFMTFVGLHAIMLAYGSYLLGMLLLDEVWTKKLFEATFISHATGERVAASSSPSVILTYLLYKKTVLCGLFLIDSVMAVVMAGFFGYHLYLALRNETTNENAKRADLRQYNTNLLKKQKQERTDAKAAETAQLFDVVVPEGVKGGQRFMAKLGDAEEKVRVLCPGECQPGSVLRIAQSGYIVSVTTSIRTETGDEKPLMERPLQRATDYKEIDVTNHYYISLWGNLKEVYCPRSIYLPPVDEATPAAEALATGDSADESVSGPSSTQKQGSLSAPSSNTTKKRRGGGKAKSKKQK